MKVDRLRDLAKLVIAIERHAFLAAQPDLDRVQFPHPGGRLASVPPPGVRPQPPRPRAGDQAGTTFTFVPDGIESALEQARVAAGDKAVAVGGGANVAQQYLKAGLLDELQIHVAPVLLGDGVRLFEDHLGADGAKLERTRVIESPAVTNLRYRIA